MPLPAERTKVGPILRTIDWVNKQSFATRVATATVSMLLLGIADWWTGPFLSFSIFYLLPISMISWHVGKHWGALLAFLAASFGLFSDLMWGEFFGSIWVPWWNAGVRFAIFLTMAMILGALRVALDRERSLAETDSLTGILNRRAFYQRGKRELQRANRYERPVTLVYLDLDRFKEVNDSLGHRTGDTLLRALTDTISSSVRATDILARIGGDEFGIILPESEPEAATIMVKRLIGKIADTMERNRWPVTMSAGVVTFLNPPESMDDLIQKADEVMYRAKRRGENSVEFEVVGD